jgi:hypothetical protein
LTLPLNEQQRCAIAAIADAYYASFEIDKTPHRGDPLIYALTHGAFISYRDDFFVLVDLNGYPLRFQDAELRGMTLNDLAETVGRFVGTADHVTLPFDGVPVAVDDPGAGPVLVGVPHAA